MTQDLVFSQNGQPLTDTSVIAKALGIKHNDVIRTLNGLLVDYPELNAESHRSYYLRFVDKEYRGQGYKAAVMNRHTFTLLFMRFTSTRARQLQMAFNDAFHEMEHRLRQLDLNTVSPEWSVQRIAGKGVRRMETDVIKQFVDYATEQGSENAKFYYKHITNATYKALDLMVQKQPKLRDTLDCFELSELILLERMVVVKLKEYMNLGRHYKDIYKSLAEDLLNYGKSLRVGVMSEQVTLPK